jgi:hypothetical protein
MAVRVQFPLRVLKKEREWEPVCRQVGVSEHSRAFFIIVAQAAMNLDSSTFLILKKRLFYVHSTDYLNYIMIRPR